jgi:uncharacterized protein
VIAVDTNILVYAHREDSPFHELAAKLIAELAEGSVAWSIPWPSVDEFLAIVTHPHIYAPPTPLARALDRVDAWLESPTLVVLAEPTEHWPTLRTILARGRIVGAQVHDARIFALCLQHGVRELWSADRDFNRFAGLAVVNPFVVRGSG